MLLRAGALGLFLTHCWLGGLDELDWEVVDLVKGSEASMCLLTDLGCDTLQTGQTTLAAFVLSYIDLNLRLAALENQWLLLV